MAGYAIVLLVNLGALALETAHRGQMRGLGALRIDVSRVKNEGNTQRAENGSIVDDEYSSHGQQGRRPQCTEVAPKQGFNIPDKNQFISIFFLFMVFLRNNILNNTIITDQECAPWIVSTRLFWKHCKTMQR